jgi:hypothetical protein
MPPIEDLLRGELKRVADTVQPGQLRPLQMPVPARRWHRRFLLPVAAAAAVIAVAVAAVLVAVPKPVPPAAPGPAAIPRYYLTFTLVTDQQVKLPVTEAVIRDSATGQITGTVKIMSDFFPASVAVAAAPDERSFILGTELAPRTRGYPEYRFFRLPISADGKPGHLTELPAYPVPVNPFVTGIALSPDGTLLAVSSTYGLGRQNGHATSEVGAIEVINLVTGTVRTWTAGMQQGHYYEPGPPSWADGNRMIAFTWQRAQSLTNDALTMEGVRLLDIEAPGDNLADSRTIMSPKAVSGTTIESALITPDGRDVLVATSHEVPPGGGRGTIFVQISEVPTSGSGPVRVLRTESARATAATQAGLSDSGQVLSLAPGGRYALVQCIQFGWLDLDLGRFTPLPHSSQGLVYAVVPVYGVW